MFLYYIDLINLFNHYIYNLFDGPFLNGINDK